MRNYLYWRGWVVGLVLVCASAAWGADEAPRARAYFDFVHGVLQAVEQDLAGTITPAAEAGAKRFIEGKNLGVRGLAGLASELGGRAGGLMAYGGQPGRDGDVILYAFGQTTAKRTDAAAVLEEELAEAQKLTQAGSLVIGIASVAQLQAAGKLDQAKGACAFVLDNHAPAGDGLFTAADGKAVAPTFPVASAAVAWTWTCEFFAACTRQGKTPTVYQSVFVDRSRVRLNKYKGQRFHEDLQVKPVAGGELGRAYVRGLDSLLRDVGTASWPALVRVAERSAAVLKDGGRVYVAAYGHYPPYHQPGELAADPGLFLRLNRGKDFVVDPGLGDYVIAIGYCWEPGSEHWGKPDVLRHAEHGVAYIITSYQTKGSDLEGQELVVDQRWAEGDALVAIPGYDVRMGPPSGIVAETIYWAIGAQVQEEVEGHRKAKKVRSQK